MATVIPRTVRESLYWSYANLAMAFTGGRHDELVCGRFFDSRINAVPQGSHFLAAGHDLVRDRSDWRS